MKDFLRFRFLFTVLLLPALFYSCGLRFLLYADFETGNTELGSISGSPDGDQMNGTDIIYALEIHPEGDNNWMSLRNLHAKIDPLERGDVSPHLDFRSIPVTYPASISYSWMMKITNGGPQGDRVTIELSDGTGVANISLGIENNREPTGPASHNLYLEPSHEFLCRLPNNQDLKFEVLISHSTNTFELELVNYSTSEKAYDSGDRSLLANSTAGVKNPTLGIFSTIMLDFHGHQPILLFDNIRIIEIL